VQATVQTLKQQLEQHKKASETLRANMNTLESKVAEAVAKKETLKARAASAQVSVRLP
jgi:phage shock protein A